MNSTTYPAIVPPAPVSTAYSGDPLAVELAALVEDIQQTREWLNSKLDAQLACLHKLCTPVPPPHPQEQTHCSLSIATLFEAPRPVLPMLPSMQGEEPANPMHKAAPAHPGVLLAPTLTATLDPQLEQATLHELNNALTRAFSEISARGGMIS